MQFATWNINGIRARIDFVLHWLRARQPDIVGLQELKVDAKGFPAAAFEELGYHCLVHGQKAWNGVAILSKEPIKLLCRGLPGQEEAGARLVAGETSGTQFFTAYCPNGKYVGHPDFAGKLAWFDSLRAFLGAFVTPDSPIVLCGDFNLCPTSLDTWDEEHLQGQIFHTSEERQRFQDLLGMGFCDLYRRLQPERRAFTWWDYRAGAFHKNQGLRIDFILATPPVSERVVSVDIDRDYRKKKEGLTASDHAPVIATTE
jgi:exodeoxyribonuclease-3